MLIQVLRESVSEGNTIKNRIIDCIEDFELDDIVHGITKMSWPFMTAYLNDFFPDSLEVKFCDGCFSQLNFIPIRFEKDVDYQKILDTLSLGVWFTYQLPSGAHIAVYKLPEPVDDIRIAKAIITALAEMHGVNGYNKSLCNKNFGTDTGTIYQNDDAILDVAKLFDEYILKLKEDKRNFAREVKRFCRNTGIKMMRIPCITTERADISELNSELVAQYAYNNTTLTFEFSMSAQAYREGKQTKLEEKDAANSRKERFNSAYTMQNCELFKEAIAHKRKLSDTELNLLLSNFKNFNGGMEEMNQILASSLYSSRDKMTWGLNGKKYNEFSLFDTKFQKCNSKKCPHFDKCLHKSIKSAGTATCLDVAQIENIELDSLSTTSRKIYSFILRILGVNRAERRGYEKVQNMLFNAIRADTGAGKTRIIIKIAIEEALKNKRIIIPSNRHNLSMQTYNDIKNTLAKKYPGKHVDVYCFTEIQKYIDDENLSKKVNYLYSVSDYNRAAFEIQKWVTEKYKKYVLIPETEQSEMQKATIQHYLASEALDKDKKNCIILMTHDKYLNSKDIKSDLTLIDEDIFEKIVSVKEFLLDDLKALRNAASEYKDDNGKYKIKDIHYINSLIDEIESETTDTCHEIKSHQYDSRAFVKFVVEKKFRYNSKVLDFLTPYTAYYAKSSYPVHKGKVFFVSKRELPENKTIIVSATISPLIYRRLFGDKINVIDLPHTKNRGKILQYAKRGFSNSAITQNIQRAKEDPNKDDDDNIIMNDLLEAAQKGVVITTKSVKDIVAKMKLNDKIKIAATYKDLEGMNDLAGQDLVVFGTHHVPPINYMLIAAVLGQKIGISDCYQKEWITVKRNGFRFPFFSYSTDPLLQELQLYILQSSLFQAIGRARPVSNNCKIYVYSNVPVPQAIIMDNEYVESAEVKLEA